VNKFPDKDTGELIEVFSPGKYSKSYRLKDKYRTADWYLVDLSENELIFNDLKRISKNIIEKFEDKTEDLLSNINNEVLRFLRNQLFKIHLDKDANELVDYYFKNSIDLPDKSVKGSNFTYIQKNRTFNKNTKDNYEQRIQEQREGKHHFKIHSSSKRVSTSITNFPKLLLPTLNFNNKKLFEIDIKSSQPYLFPKLLDNALVNENIPIADKDKFKEEIDKYVLLLKSGIYEQIQKVFNESSRETVKNLFFKDWFYCKETKNSKLKNYFKSEFPLIVAYVDEYKTKYGYKSFSIKLQDLEADVVLYKVIKRFLDEYSCGINDEDYFITTRHDSIIMNEEIKDLIHYLLEIELTEFVGIKPMLVVHDLKDIKEYNNYQESIKESEPLKSLSTYQDFTLNEILFNDNIPETCLKELIIEYEIAS